MCQFLCDLPVAAAVGGNAVFLGQLAELCRALDLVGVGLALGRQSQCVDDVAPVIRVRRRTTKQGPQQVASDDGLRGGPADTHLGALAAGVDATGTHETVSAAEALLAEFALDLLGFQPVPNGFHSGLFGQVYHVKRGRVDRTLLPLSHGVFPSELKRLYDSLNESFSRRVGRSKNSSFIQT